MMIKIISEETLAISRVNVFAWSYRQYMRASLVTVQKYDAANLLEVEAMKFHVLTNNLEKLPNFDGS